MSQDTTTTARRSATSVPETETAYRQPKPNAKAVVVAVGLLAFLAGVIFASVLGYGMGRSSRREARMCVAPDSNDTQITKRHAAGNKSSDAAIPEVAAEGGGSRERPKELGSSDHTSAAKVTVLLTATAKTAEAGTYEATGTRPGTPSLHSVATPRSTASVSGQVSIPNNSSPNFSSVPTLTTRGNRPDDQTTSSVSQLEPNNQEQNSSSDPFLGTGAHSSGNTSEIASSEVSVPVESEPSKGGQNSSKDPISEATGNSTDKLRTSRADDSTANAVTNSSKNTVEPASDDAVTAPEHSSVSNSTSQTDRSQIPEANVTGAAGSDETGGNVTMYNVTTTSTPLAGTTVMTTESVGAVTVP